MKLYYSKGACSLADRIIINELGLSCEYEAVDIKSKPKVTETGEEFLKINPKGAVPVLLTDEGQLLTENSVILQYLAESTNATELLPPKNNFTHYQILEWLNFVSTDIHKGFGPLFNPSLPQEIKEKFFIPILKSKLAYIDNELADRQYLISEHFTLPDAYLFVMLTWTYHFKIDLAEWPNLLRYYRELEKRPSIKQSLQDEGILRSTKEYS